MNEGLILDELTINLVDLTRGLIKEDNGMIPFLFRSTKERISKGRIYDLTEAVIITRKRIRGTVLSKVLGRLTTGRLTNNGMNEGESIRIRNGKNFLDLSLTGIVIKARDSHFLGPSINTEAMRPTALGADFTPNFLEVILIKIEFQGGTKRLSELVGLHDILGDVERDCILSGENRQRTDVLYSIIGFHAVT